MKKIFIRLAACFVLFALNVVPVFAQTQFSILPFTNKTPEECKKILDDFDQQPKIPNDSYIQKVAQNQKDAETLFNARSANDDAQKSAKDTAAAYKKAKDDFAAANPGQQCGVSYGGSCNAAFDAAQKAQEAATKAKADMDAAQKAFDQSGQGVSDNNLDVNSLLGMKDHLLGCAIKTGRISLAMIPYFITYFANFLLGLSGSITVLFLVIGGYRYVLGGLTEEKEKGKQTIFHALMGFGVALLAWAIVNIVMSAVTG